MASAPHLPPRRRGRAPRVVVFARNYPPEKTGIGPLTADLCAHLARRGFHVLAIAAAPHFPEWRVYPGYSGLRLPVERAEGVLIRRVPIYVSGKPATGRARLLYDLSYALGAFWQALRAPPFDLLVCVGSPLLAALPAIAVARWRRVPLVVIFQDLEAQIAEQLHMLRSGLLLRAARWVEVTAARQATQVCVISESFKDYLATRSAPAAKLHVLPNWVDTDFVRPLPRGSFLAERCGLPPDTPIALYSGNLGEKQGLDILMHAATHLRAHGIHLVFVGDGAARPRLEAMVAESGADNVHFLPLQPRADLPRMLASADVLTLTQRAEVVDSVVPSKLLTYMASGRAIVAAMPPRSEAARHISAAGCGPLVQPADVQALAAAIVRAAIDRDAQGTWGRNARAYAEEHFARARILKRYEEIFDMVIAQHRA